MPEQASDEVDGYDDGEWYGSREVAPRSLTRF